MSSYNIVTIVLTNFIWNISEKYTDKVLVVKINIHRRNNKKSTNDEEVLTLGITNINLNDMGPML